MIAQRIAHRTAVLGALAALLGFADPVFAQDDAPANNLADLRRELERCFTRTPLGAGSRVTIVFGLKRDGSLLGRPRITYAHLEGDADARARFLSDAERAVDACLPVRITPSFGEAIAGRFFWITLGRRNPQQSI